CDKMFCFATGGVTAGRKPVPLPAAESSEHVAEGQPPIVIGVVLSIIILMTIAGNGLVIISVCIVKKLRQPSNYLVVSLAAADLSVAFAVMPFPGWVVISSLSRDRVGKMRSLATVTVTAPGGSPRCGSG
uniref:G-protein coupled receptors family 1 profile domain-containing protein n=1 Tax=Meleagris gallopavo TaxID=9103 RepID=A0A803Y106_MELGA